VKNVWAGTNGMFHQLLADRRRDRVDPRQPDGEREGRGVRLAGLPTASAPWSCRDVEDGIAYLKRQPWSTRTASASNGWSYGGFMVTYALTHSRSFAMGIAGGPVTDWRHYDSIYTERYMKTPAHNPEGYNATSPWRRPRPARQPAPHPRRHRRQRAPTEHPALRQRAAEGGQAVPPDAVPKARHGVVDPSRSSTCAR